MCRWVGNARAAPAVDANQDVTMTMAQQVNGWTTISFTRPRVTRDSAPVDVSLDNPVFFLWATGPERNFDANSAGSIGQHTSRGSSSEMMRFPSADQCPGKSIVLLSCAHSISAYRTKT